MSDCDGRAAAARPAAMMSCTSSRVNRPPPPSLAFRRQSARQHAVGVATIRELLSRHGVPLSELHDR